MTTCHFPFTFRQFLSWLRDRLATLETRAHKVFDFCGRLFAIFSVFGSSSRRECDSASAPPRHSAFPTKLRRFFLRLLTPTGNKRFNELIGFLCITLAVLIALALLSYSPKDASFNVSAAAFDGSPARNWIGPAGAYGADLLFQIFGFAAFLLPAAILVLGWRWLRSRALDSQVATVVGFGLLLVSLPTLLSLWHVWDVRGAVPPGGLLGELISGGLRTGFNLWGANLVAVALLVTALFMTTRFSFSGAHAWANGPHGPIGAVEKLGILQKAQARWQAWREEREQQRMRRRVEESRLSGRKPVPQQLIGKAELLNEASKTIRLADESEEEEDEKETKDSSRKAPIFVLNRDTEKSAAKKGEPKIAKGNPNYKLPSPSLLREGERGQKLDEEELKQRARAIEAKCLEFDIQGRVTQINPGPVVTTFEFKPDAGIKYSRIIGLTEDLCLALQAESILIERIPGKSTIGIEVPNDKRQTIALREIIEAPEFMNSPSKLTLAMGRDLHGRIRVTELAAMPHLLIDNLEETEHKPLPYLIIVIDELADLMMVDTNNVEESITRLAQMARAVGIHLILATQRPSVDVITGLIKANFPARISFRVASKVDSRTILDSNGSESLLGRGDMLYLPAGSARLHRIHGPLVTEDEITAVCDFWREQAQAKYQEELLAAPKDENGKAEGATEGDAEGGEDVDDNLYQDAIRVVCDAGRASTSTLQRRLRIGYGRAARLIDLMEKDGIVGPPDGTKPREVLKNRTWMKEFDDSAH